MQKSSFLRTVVVICCLSLCINAYFVIRHVTERSDDERGMAMTPYYLSLALVSLTVEFNRKEYPQTIVLPANPELQMAYASYTAAEPLYNEYGYDTKSGAVLYFLDQLRNQDDLRAYHELLGLKPFLPYGWMPSSKIQPLFDAIARELQSTAGKS